ncbi:MAG: endonuclease/exonuclease/phosphatase family protein [Pseudomonadota bacterium]
MKLISWNAQQKFREKIQHFCPREWDVLVVQECEFTDTAIARYREAGWHGCWDGENRHKGLGVFVPLGSSITRLDWAVHGCRHFLPVRLGNGVVLVGVWAMGGTSPSVSYAGQVARFIEQHGKQIAAGPALLIGDFNSNAIWDTRHKTANHTRNHALLNAMGLQSLYHVQHAETQGQERIPTFYLYRHRHKPYHLDYAYLPDDIVGASSLVVGDPDTWLQLSDHMPLFIDVAVHGWDAAAVQPR